MSFAAMWLLLAGAFGQMEDEFYHDLRSGEVHPALKRFGPSGGDVMRSESDGLRITLPAARKDSRAVGLSPIFSVSGDFEITLAYEILKAEPGAAGVGVNVGVIVGTPMREAARLGRYIYSKKGPVYSVSRMSAAGGRKPRGSNKTFPAQAPTGKLRVKRAASVLHFQVAEGSNDTFRELCQLEFVGDDGAVRFAANTGSGPALDARFLDLSVRADRLPRKPIPGNPSTGWWIWVIVAAMGIGITLVVVRWRRAAR